VTSASDYEVVIWSEYYPTSCFEQGFISWAISDKCGNLGIGSPSGGGNLYTVEWNINSNGASQKLDWIGAPEDFLPPEDITIQFSDQNCTNDFDPCMWRGRLDGSNVEETWIWELLPDVHYRGGCDISVYYSHTPCSNFSGPVTSQNPLPELVEANQNSVLTTEVCVQITDKCSTAELEYCFDVTVQCGSCGQFGNIYCETCEDADPPLQDGGCKLCDPVELAEGYQSCTPPCVDPTCPILGPPQPAMLCETPGFVPHNMSWFAFVASADNMDVEVFIFNCIGAGVQSGIYSSCDFTEPCVGYNVNCSINGTIDYNASLNVGQTYYMFVDGCNGSECEYEVTVNGLNELVPDDIDAIMAYSLCSNNWLTDDLINGATNASESGNCEVANFITVCPEELLQFSVIHQGNLGNFPENDDPCDNYPLLDASFQWSTSWGGSYNWNPYEEDNGEFIEVIEMPSDVGVYNICLDFIDYECFPVIGPKCLEVHVEASGTGTYYEDADGDGYGTGDPVELTCPVPAGYACIAGDCNDGDPNVNVPAMLPMPRLECRTLSADTILFSWDERTGFNYTIDYSQMPANLVTIEEIGQVLVTGFVSSCQYAVLGIEVDPLWR